MRINYQVLSVALLLSLSRVGLGQTAPAPTHEDSVKGQIWTATARRVWTDEKATPPATKWATGTDFSKWVLTQQNDKAELGSLWKAVRDQVGKDQPATPAQLAKAILTEINKRKTNKTGALAKVNLQSLQVDLEPFVPAGSTTSAVVAPDSGTPAAQPASASRTVAEDENPTPEVRALPAAATYTSQPLEPRYFGMPPALAGAVLALLGALLGYGIASNRSKSKRRHHRQHSSSPSPVEPENSSDMNPLEYRKLQNQNQQLRKELQQIKKQLAELQKQLTGTPAASVPAPAAAAHISATSLAAAAAAAQAAEAPAPMHPAPPVAAAPPATEELSIEEMVGATPQPAATRYGPVQESAFLEERKIVDSPLPQLALMLTVNPRNPDQASFTLNPNVDQARLIGDGLTRLQKFFDYDPPLGGRITLVTAAAPGQLQRQADGWQVVQRARLNIS